MHKQDARQYLDVAIDAAKKAGKYLSARAFQSHIVDMNLLHDLKLQIDKRSEALLIRYLQKHTTFPILSEECGLVGSKKDNICWIVDPLDGTINYSRIIPFSCVSIGLWQEEKAILGVVYDFCRKEMFSGVVGQGAWLNGHKIMVSRVRKKEGAILATGFPAKMDLSRKNLESFTRKVSAYKKLRLMGSAALSLAYVAAGRFDAYTESDIMFWDVAGGIALIEAAGGKVIMKKSNMINGYHVLACNGNFRM
ncbi:MAG: inositol monophosphatase family protein [Candidatus Omnitrophota bacterium]|nr:inositol monophosphatase family protein [Candidatus Omnitrophota bacterium]